MAEGGNINRPPFFDGINYAYWKVRMRAFLIAIDEKVWQAVEFGWKHPTEVVDNITVPKTRTKWTKDENEQSSCNGKGINALFNSLNQTEFSRVSACETSKEIWDTLKTTHEGTSLVKVQKLQMLTSRFDSIHMEENENFTEYYTRLQEIVNTCSNLGEKIPETKIIRKILRTLPERFRPKVAAIETVKHPDEMKVDELVGALQTYEMTFPTNSSSSKLFLKSTGMALKASKGGNDDSSTSETDSDVTIEDLEKQIALLTRKFRRSFKKRFPNSKSSSYKTNKSKGSTSSSSSRNRNFENPSKDSPRDKKKEEGQIQCYKCRGFGHIASDCPTKVSKKKAMQAITWDDPSDEESSSGDEEINATALVAHDTNVFCLSSIDSISASSTNEQHTTDEDSDGGDMIDAYRQLIVESKKIGKLNKKLQQQIVDLEGANASLRTSTRKLEQEKDGLSRAYDSIVEKVTLLENERETHEEDVKFLTKQLTESKEANMEFTKTIIGLRMDLNKFSSGTSKLDKMLGLGQTSKLGLGYERTYVDQAPKQVGVNTTKTNPKVQGNLSSRKSFTNKVCHHCGVLGHVKRTCRQKKNSMAHVNQRMQFKPTKVTSRGTSMQIWNSKRKKPILKKRQVWKVKNDVPKTGNVRNVDKLHKRISSQPTHPKIRKVWVRKGEIFPY